MQRPRIEAFLFDLDNTLYPPSVGLLRATDRALTGYISQRLGLPRQEADALRLKLWRRYGTTARGLAEEYGLPLEEIIAHILEHADPARFLGPNPAARRLLQRLRVPAWLLTNSPREYARRALRAMGLEGVFAGVIAIEDLQWVGKPAPEALLRAAEIVGQPPERIGLADDDLRTIRAARELGMFAVLVGDAKGCEPPCAASLAELEEILRQAGVC